MLANWNSIICGIGKLGYFLLTPLLLLLVYISISFDALAAEPIDISKHSIRNGFYVRDKALHFKETIRGETCKGTIHYPYMTNEAEDIFIEINEEIHDFVEIYSICNEDDKDNYSVSYKIPESHLKDFFSVVWSTKKDDKLWRVDALTFDRDQGDLIKLNQVFNPLAQLMYSKMIELSEGHLSAKQDWGDFLANIARRDIQIYVDKGEWMIVFNPTPELNKLVQKKLPNYFLIGDDVANTR